MVNFKMSDVVVLDSAGVPNVQASVDKFRDALNLYVASNSADLNEIGAAIHRVYDKFRGAHLNAKSLQSFTLQELPAIDPSAITMVFQRIEAYMKSHTADKKRTDGKCPDGSEPLFAMRRGPNGGTARISDLKPETPAA